MQATGLKEEVALDQPSKGQKGGMVVDVAKIEMLRPSDSGTAISSPQADTTMDSGRAGESAVARSPKINSTIALPESSILKPSIRPLAPLGAPMVINRFKLDNRPTAFKILPPLPAGLANVISLLVFLTYSCPCLQIILFPCNELPYVAQFFHTKQFPKSHAAGSEDCFFFLNLIL